MRTVAWFSVLLIMGLLGSQWLPSLGSVYPMVAHGILTLTMIALAFIMIHVGYEFELDKARLGEFAQDDRQAPHAGWSDTHSRHGRTAGVLMLIRVAPGS